MADIFLYNYLTSRKEKFNPISSGRVGLYTCGPTVYDFVHIGNLRTYLFEDILRRVLEHNSFEVTQVMNLTDVEDKIIKKMKEESKSLKEVTQPFSQAFFQDLDKLNIQKASQYPEATAHISEMIDIITKLLEKGIAYQKDGSVYFSLDKFPDYGKLSKLDKREIKPGARVNVDEYQKENAEDFVLWKKTEVGEPSWEAPFGMGRPGWHIECSAMSMKYLGESFDIHTGAVDLIFPHHENEIAQSEAFSGKKFVNYWLEADHLLVDNQKMAKSLKNIFTLKDIEDKKINPLAFRYLVLSAHYRSKLNFTWDSLQSAENSLKNLYDFASGLKEVGNSSSEYEEKFLEAVNDDLDLPKAMSILWNLVKSEETDKTKAATLLRLDRILGLNLDKEIAQPTPEGITQLVNEREVLKQKGDYDQADKIRRQIEAQKYYLKDSPQGTAVYKKH
jgi:cysteinyl-tRNA synthetase